jgi:hypothetical protein
VDPCGNYATESTSQGVTTLALGVTPAPVVSNIPASPTPIGVIDLDLTPIVVKEHRSIVKPVPFMITIIQDAKNRFGCPELNRANLLAVRKYCLDTMRSNGVRPTHINQCIDTVVQMVFVKNVSELECDRLMDCLAARVGYAAYNNPTWTSWIRNVMYYVFSYRVTRQGMC